MAWEGARLAVRRLQGDSESELPLEAAGRATQDAVTVLVEGYEATSRTEKVLFNMLTGFVFAFALIRLSTAGILPERIRREYGLWWSPAHAAALAVAARSLRLVVAPLFGAASRVAPIPQPA